MGSAIQVDTHSPLAASSAMRAKPMRTQEAHDHVAMMGTQSNQAPTNAAGATRPSMAAQSPASQASNHNGLTQLRADFSVTGGTAPCAGPEGDNVLQQRSVQFPFDIDDHVTILGNKRTPDKFVGKEAVVLKLCLNGWCLLRMCSSGDTVRLQYRSLARYNPAMDPDKREERSAEAPPPVSAPRPSGTSVSSVTSGASTITPPSASATPQGSGSSHGGKRLNGGTETTGGNETTAGKEVTGGKELTNGREMTGGKEATAGKQVTGVTEVTGGKELIGGKELTSGKEVTGGKELTGRKEVTGGKELTGGKDLDGGKKPIGGKELIGGKEVTGGKELISGKEVIGGKQVTGVKEPIGGKDLTGGKELTDGKEPTGGKELTGGKDLNGGKKLVEGKELTGGKELTVGKKLISGKGVTGGRKPVGGKELTDVERSILEQGLNNLRRNRGERSRGNTSTAPAVVKAADRPTAPRQLPFKPLEEKVAARAEAYKEKLLRKEGLLKDVQPAPKADAT